MKHFAGELRRLFQWLKVKRVTALLINAEQGGHAHPHGLEEYVADCVIALDHRVIDQISTRRLRVVKYRGSVHGADEYPFLIHPNGISLLPITSLNLDHTAPTDRVSTGIERLDTMMGGKGYYRGSSIWSGQARHAENQCGRPLCRFSVQERLSSRLPCF